MERLWIAPRLLALLALVGALAAGPTPAIPEAASSPPAVSASGLFLGGYTKREEPAGAATAATGLYTQQVELRVAAPVDSGTAARVTLALPRDGQLTFTEAYLVRQLSPVLELQAGRFYADFGHHNRLHPHQFPFLDPPLVLQRFFGASGIDEVGLGLRRVLPTPWRAALSVQLLNGDNPMWANNTDEDLLLVTHLSNAGLGAGAAVELGATWATGRNLRERYTNALGGDLTIDWRRAGGPRWLTWETEYVLATENLKEERRTRGGVSTNLQYRCGRRWWVQGRYDYYGLPRDRAEGWEDRFTALVAFVPDPRTPLRFDYSRWRVDRTGRGYNQYHVQLNFTIGSESPRPAAGE
ncbi:MAG: hypothetical protein ABIL09_18395 [Gemmatimonadota bacterium]